MDIWVILLFVLTFVLFMLPLAPALIELAYPTDNMPLRVVQEHENNLTFFASGFRSYVRKNFGNMMEGHSKESSLADGTRFHILGADQQKIQSGGKPVDKLVISNHPINLPGEALYEHEIYSGQSISCGRGSYLRAALAEGDIVLQEKCSVLRWVHAENTLHVAPQCMLFGRASAGARIVIAPDTGFERLQASRIEFGDVSPHLSKKSHPHDNLKKVEELPNVRRRFKDRWLINGDVKIDAKSYFKGDIVARGNVEIGEGSKIDGSIKANGNLYLGRDVEVEGSIVCTGEMHIDSDCVVLGPTISEDAISIASGAVVGREASLTSVNALWVYVEEGAMVHGTVWATEEGSVEPKNGKHQTRVA